MMYLFRNIYKIINTQIRLMSNLQKFPMEILEGNQKLLDCRGILVNAHKALQNKKIIALYFSAAWCNPCKVFLPQIKAMYKVNLEKKMGLEIIYVSSDEDEKAMHKYFYEKHSRWLAVPFDDPLIEELKTMFGVESIPHFFVLDSKGNIVSRNGRKDIEEHGANVLVKWNTDPI